MNSSDIDLFRLLDFVREMKVVYSWPIWLCDIHDIKRLEKEGLLTPSERKPFIPRHGSSFIGYTLTEAGQERLLILLYDYHAYRQKNNVLVDEEPPVIPPDEALPPSSYLVNKQQFQE